MNGIRYAKEHVLRCTNTEIARITDVSRLTVACWLNDDYIPNFSKIMLLRAEILHRGLTWDDQWWFDPPTQKEDDSARGSQN